MARTVVWLRLAGAPGAPMVSVLGLFRLWLTDDATPLLCLGLLRQAFDVRGYSQDSLEEPVAAA